MSPRILAVSLVLALGAVAPCSSAAPPEGGKEEGRTRFHRGIELYKEGNFHAALAEFRAAYEAAPSVRIQYNLGQTLFQLQDYAGALTAFEAYLGEGREKIPEDRVREVEADVAKLRQRVATLKVTIANVEAASTGSVSVTVDDETRTLKQGTVRVSAGRRKVAVTASGYLTETRILDVAGSAVVELRFELKPIFTKGASEGAGKPVTPPPAPASIPKSRAPLYIGLGATAALGASAIAFAVVASNEHSAWDKAQNQPNPNKSELDDLRSSTKTFALVADIFTGATIAAGATSLVLLFVTSGDREPTPKTAKGPTVRPTVHPTVGPQSLGLRGTF